MFYPILRDERGRVTPTKNAKTQDDISDSDHLIWQLASLKSYATDLVGPLHGDTATYVPANLYNFDPKCLFFLFQIFFVLRKKQSHVTFLHVYHHLLVFSAAWFFCKYVDGKFQCFFNASY